jgi:hypothetical protein
MLKSYRQHVVDINQINEGIFDFLGKLFSGAFKMVSDQIKNNVKDFSNLIKNKKSLKDALPELKKQFENMNTEFEKFTTEQKSLPEYKQQVKDYFSEVYMILDSISRKFNADKYKPFNFYQNTKNPLFKKIFQYEKPENFMKNLDAHVTSILKDQGKKSGMNDNELAKFDEAIKESLKIFEQGEETTTQTTQTTQTDPNAQQTQGSSISPEIMTKFEDSVKNFIKDDLLMPLSKQLETSINDSKDDVGGAQIQKVASTIPDNVSNNIESKKTIIKSISEIGDKNTLIKIRDILGLSKEDTPL